MGIAEVGGTICWNRWKQYGADKPMENLKGTSTRIKRY